MKNCTYCGATLPEGARLCGACGKLLSPSGSLQPSRTDDAASEESGSVLRSNVASFDASAERGYRPLLVEAPRAAVSSVYEHAWRQLKAFFLPLFVVGVVYVLIEIPVTLVDLALEERAAVRVAFQVLAGCFISVPVGLGLAYAYLRAARGERPAVGDLFAAYRRNAMFTGLAASVLYGIFVVVGLLLLIVPGIIVGLRLSLYTFLVVDEGYGPVAALRESWERTRGHGWTVLAVSLLAIPIVLLGLIALVVGLIPAVMLVQLAQASLFIALSTRGGREA